MKIRHFSTWIACAALTGAASAADLTWDGNSSPGITNTSAAWDAENVWFDGENNVSFTADDNVTFTATASQGYAVSTGTTGPYSVGNMTFDSTSDSASGINLNAPAVALSGAATTAVGHTGLVNFQGLVSGNGSFTIGGGELRLINNGNTFSGDVTLNAGILRVGNGNGVGNPQTSGSLGTGTFTINSGTIFQNQGNTRTQAVSAVIGGNFSFNSVAGGGLTLGGTTSNPTDIGNVSRIITVSQNSDGTGASSFFGLRNLIGGASSNITKNGAGTLIIESRKDPDFLFNGTMTLNAGEIRLSAANSGTNASDTATGDIGVTRVDVASGCVLRINSNDVLNRGAIVTLNGGALVNRNNLGTNRRSGLAALQVTGTSIVDRGSGLLIATTGTTGVSEIRVAESGVLGGNGTLRMATGAADFSDPPTNSIPTPVNERPSYLENGVTTFNTPIDAPVNLRFSGFISPGAPDALDSTIATLSLGSLVWQGHSSATPMRFNLGSFNQSDSLALSGNFGRDGATLVHRFDFLNSGEPGQTYTLVTFATADAVGEADAFEESMFVATNLADGVTGSFSLTSNALLFITDGEGGGTPFEEWAAGAPYNLSGDDALPGADPDNDGVPNLIEFALNGDPTSGSDNGKQFVKMATVDSVPNVLTLTIAVRDGASFAASGNRQAATVDEIIYTVEASNDLADWGTPVVTEVTGADATAIQTGLPALDTGWTYHTFRSDGSASADNADFMRLNVEEVP